MDKPTDEEDENTKKSERKRQRERQRRSELTNAFDELAALIVRVDNHGDGSEDIDGKRSGRGEGAEGSRFELILRTLAIMERLQRENDELKQTLSQLRETLDRQRDQVFVMVPQLVPTNQDTREPAQVTSFPVHYHQRNRYPPGPQPPPPQQQQQLQQPPTQQQPHQQPPSQPTEYGEPYPYGSVAQPAYPPSVHGTSNWAYHGNVNGNVDANNPRYFPATARSGGYSQPHLSIYQASPNGGLTSEQNNQDPSRMDNLNYDSHRQPSPDY